MERLTVALRRLCEIGFTLAPLGLALYLLAFQQPPLILRHHGVHEAAILVATLLGMFVSLVAWRCFLATGEVFARYLFLGLASFTFLYALHGAMTFTDTEGPNALFAERNIWLFILFGPVSRLVFALFLTLGVWGYDHPRVPPGERRAWHAYVMPIAVNILLVPGTIVLALSPVAGDFALRAAMEGATVLLCLACIARLTLRPLPFATKRYVMVGLALVAQSAFVFLLTGAWTHLWWLAHVIFAAGFFALSYGVARAYHGGRSFSAMFSEEEMLARLAEAEEMHDSLRRARDEAEAASLSKSRFLASMSHELRTPLNAVIGFSQAMTHEMFGPLGNPKYRDYARMIRDSGEHLLALINDVLDVSRIEVGVLSLSPEPLSLAEVVEASLAMVRERAEGGKLALRVDLPADLPPLTADRRRIMQVLINLLSNAVKFSPDGGTITVDAAREDDGGLRLRVIDTGIGIAPQDIAKAMTLFGQVDDGLNRRYEGAGLGLPLARSLMELHGGSLELVSAAGAGTTVTLRFPPDLLQSETP